MSPATIEGQLKLNTPLIGAMALIGEGQRYNTALVVLDPDVATARFGDLSPAELASTPAVVATIADGIARGNDALSRVEQVKRFAVLPTFWEPGGDELTPTMKTKRKPISAKYADHIERMYLEPKPPEVQEVRPAGRS